MKLLSGARFEGSTNYSTVLWLVIDRFYVSPSQPVKMCFYHHQRCAFVLEVSVAPSKESLHFSQNLWLFTARISNGRTSSSLSSLWWKTGMHLNFVISSFYPSVFLRLFFLLLLILFPITWSLCCWWISYILIAPPHSLPYPLLHSRSVLPPPLHISPVDYNPLTSCPT